MEEILQKAEEIMEKMNEPEHIKSPRFAAYSLAR